MSMLIRGTMLAVVGAAFLGMAGCGADNEAEADKLQAKAGAVPKPEEGSTKEAGPPVKSYEDYAKTKQGGNQGPPAGYPGAKPAAKK